MTQMSFRRRLVFPLAAGLALTGISGCCLIPGYGAQAAGAASLTEAQLPVVTGTATYRERMMAPAGSVLTAVLQDTSRADAAAVDLASWSVPLDGVSVPQRFTLAPETALDARMTYTVRATIKGPDGDLLWTTDTAHRVPPGQTGPIDMGELVMVKVAPQVPPAEDVPVLAGTAWSVDAMGQTGLVSGSEPTIAFSKDGRISGTTGCNQFFGGYTQDGAALTFTGVGMTKMACMADGLMQQEATFVSILNGEAKASLDAGSKLTIMGAAGVGFVALPVLANAAPGDPALLRGAEWLVEDLNRMGVIDNSRLTLKFGEDGRVSGSTNCNSFGGTYSVDGSKMTLSPLAMTRKACAAEALANQEARYTGALSGELGWRFAEDGALVLTGDEDTRILLRR